MADFAIRIAGEPIRVNLGESTTEAARQAALAAASAEVALATANYYSSKATGEAATVTGDFFAYPDGAGGIIYAERTAGGSIIIAEAPTRAAVEAAAATATSAQSSASASAVAAAESATTASTAATTASTAATNAAADADRAEAAEQVATDLGNTPIYASLASLPTASGTGNWAIIPYGADEGIYRDSGSWTRVADSQAVRATAEADRAEAAADSVQPEAVAAALDGKGWLAADALTLTGPAAGLTWSATHLAIAEAIKEIEVFAAASMNAENWYIGTVANADASSKDQFIVRRASDNAVVASLGSVDATRRPDGLGELVVVGTGVSIRAVIDYSALSTGILLNAATPTPLFINKKNGASKVSNRALLDSKPVAPWRNLFPNGNFDEARGVNNVTTGVWAGPPTSKVMSQRGIKRALKVGTGGSGTIFPDSGAIFTADDASTGRWMLIGCYSYSANGTTWPNIGAYFYTAAGSNYASRTLNSFIEIDANNRFYFTAGKLLLPTTASDIIGGKVRVGQQSDQSGSGTALEFGGLTVFTADRVLHPGNTPKQDWYTGIADAGLNSLTSISGKRIVFLGDSIMDDYGVPEAVAAKLGATAHNFAWEGTRLSKRASGSYQSRDGVSIAEAVAASNFTQLVSDVNADYPTGSAYHVAKRATAAEMAAFNWSTADIIVCAWGTNDYSGSVQLGASTSAVQGEFNGGLNEFIRILQTALPNAQIVFCTPAFRNTSPDSETSTNANGAMLQAFVDAIKDRAEKRGHHPVIDLHKTLGINAYNATTFYGDTVHPNSSTGKERWASRIAAGLSGFVR